jgi:hypothetical protein
MAWRLARLRRLPPRFEEAVVSKPNQNGVEGSGLETGTAADVIAMTPLSRNLQKFAEDACRLRSAAELHGINLHI